MPRDKKLDRWRALRNERRAESGMADIPGDITPPNFQLRRAILRELLLAEERRILRIERLQLERKRQVAARKIQRWWRIRTALRAYRRELLTIQWRIHYLETELQKRL